MTSKPEYLNKRSNSLKHFFFLHFYYFIIFFYLTFCIFLTKKTQVKGGKQRHEKKRKE